MKKIFTLTHFILILVFLLSLTGPITHSVQAQTCTWTGSISTYWYTVGNWDGCFDGGGNPKYPGPDDDVTIPSDLLTYPVLIDYQHTIDIKSLTIASNAKLIIDEQSNLYAEEVNNYGTIEIEEVAGHSLRIDALFNNYGSVSIGSQASAILYKSGTHSGSFTGKQLSLIKSGTQRVNTFTSTANIEVQTFYVGDNNTAIINGTFNCFGNLYIKPNSSVTISATGLGNLGSVNIDSGELIIQLDGGTSNPGENTNLTAGSILSGEGTLQTNLTNAGIVSPGSSPGKISIEGDYTQESGGSLNLELGGTIVGTEYDQLVVTGSAALGGTLNVTPINGFTPTVGDSFTLLSYGTHTGKFTTENLPDLDPGLRWQIDYHSDAVVLEVVEVGSISGTVFYDGSLPLSKIEVNAFYDVNAAPHKKGVIVEVGADYVTYVIDDLTPADFFVSAFVDIDGDGGPPLPNEPVAWYDHDSDGAPNAVKVQGGETTSNINITLNDPYMQTFLPLILR